MYCPNCGSEEREATPFCRNCGRDMRPVRTAVAAPNLAGSTAREEIGRAFAARIRDIRDADEMSTFAEEVLPEIEKFLETPWEKRMRRLRTGMILTFIGVGVAIGMSLAAALSHENDMFFLAALGIVTAFLGLGFILNGLLLTVPKASAKADQNNSVVGAIDQHFESVPERNPNLFTSITETTTRHLMDKKPGE
jgi:hypothetical protein